MTRAEASLVVALTGGIASGKTAVSDAFAALGVPVIDTDLIAREVVAPGSPGLAEVVAAFGASSRAPDGSLNRAALRQIIFTNAGARARLEAILHPRIATEARRRLQTVQHPYCILVVPLLVESGLFENADRILVVDVPEALQIQRLMRRDGADRDQAEAALSAQISREQRLARADDVIDNSASLVELQTSVAELDAFYRELAGADRAR